MDRGTTVAACIQAASEAFGVPVYDIESARLSRPIARARMAACWLARHGTDRSLNQIARVIGRDHTSVAHAIKRADELRTKHPEFGRKIEAALRRVMNPEQAEMAL